MVGEQRESDVEQLIPPAERQTAAAASGRKLSVAAVVSLGLGLAASLAVFVGSRRDLGADVTWSAWLPQKKEAAQPASGAASWVAEPWGACSSSCDPPIKARMVSCVGYWDGVAVADERCSNQTSPDRRVQCSCELEVCFPNTTDGCVLPSSHKYEGHSKRSAEPGDFEEVGCFELAADDNLSAWKRSAQGRGMDRTCLGWAGQGPCRSGLPFFRSSKPEHLQPLGCFDFCIRKGLDLAGLVSGAECRCGASVLNQDAWHGHTANASLTFPFSTAVHSDLTGNGCPIRLLRYTGFFQFGGVPVSLTSHHLADAQYIDSIVAGYEVTEEGEEPQHENYLRLLRAANSNAAERKMQGGVAPKWERSCYPEACGPAINWDVRVNVKPAGVTTRYKEYTLIPYWFSPGTDDKRKSAFREAVKSWAELTCLVLEEKSGQVENGVEVGEFDANSCYATMGKTTHGQLNLGWCNDMAHLGSMIHEIGHTIGMLHEQSRQDAQEEYHGHGPYLHMYWQNLKEGWASQYFPDPNGYIGSSNQQDGDPFSGYSNYDFGSLMHYWQGGGAEDGKNAYDTIPPSKVDEVGQRGSLSPADILQANDMYQCIEGCAGKGKYVSGPRVSNWLLRRCSRWAGTLLEAKEKCDCTPGCQVIHDYQCDNRGWRVCTKTLDEFVSASVGIPRACTMYVGKPRAYAIGPKVGSARRLCGRWMGTLAEAKAKCDSTPGCSVLHDYGCDGRNWRVCKSDISKFSTVRSNSCTRTAVIPSESGDDASSEYRYENGPMVTANPSGLCGRWWGTLDEAKAKCSSTADCNVLHDYGCDNRNWRICSSSIDSFTTVRRTVRRRACTKVRKSSASYIPGPKVARAAYPYCERWTGTLEQAKARCDGIIGCNVLHDTGCDNLDWRVCGSSITDFPSADDAADSSCTMTRNLPQICAVERVTLNTQTYANEISWTIESASHGQIVCESSDEYEDGKVYALSCCLPPGDYVLTAKDSYKDGWHGGSITIGGTSYIGELGWEKFEAYNQTFTL